MMRNEVGGQAPLSSLTCWLVTRRMGRIFADKDSKDSPVTPGVGIFCFARFGKETVCSRKQNRKH